MQVLSIAAGHRENRAVICGMTIAFLLVVALVILVVGMVIGAIMAVVGIKSEQKLEEGERG